MCQERVHPLPANKILLNVPNDRIRIISQHYVHDKDGRKYGPHGEPRKVHGVAVYDYACDATGLWSKYLNLKNSEGGALANPKRQPSATCPRCTGQHAGEC